MANDISLWQDLEYIEKALKLTKNDKLAHQAWLKEEQRVKQEWNKLYPDVEMEVE